MSGRANIGSRRTELQIGYAMLCVAIGRWGEVFTCNKLSVIGHWRADGSATLSAWYKARRVAAFRMTAAHKIECAGIGASQAVWWPILQELAGRRTLVMLAPAPTHPISQTVH